MVIAVFPRILVVCSREDDPRKNTAIKMLRFGFAEKVAYKRIPGKPLVLDPYARIIIGAWHRPVIDKYGILVYDASWKKLTPRRFKRIPGIHAKLPPLLPGNPVNYTKPCMLSSIEAVAATLYITGYNEAYEKLLGLYKWMNTFHTLNKELLEKYKEAETPQKLEHVIKEYWGEKPPC